MIALMVTKLLLLPGAILAVALLEGSETALTSLSGMSIAQLKIRHPHLKFLFEFWESRPDWVITSIILGNTLATVACGVLAASIGQDLSILLKWPSKWLVPGLSFLVTSGVLLFGEIIPKALARQFPEQFSTLVIVFLVPFTQVIHRAVQALVWIAGLFVRILGTESHKEIPTMSPADFMGMMETGSSTETASSSHRILKNILEFGRLKVEDVKRPMDKVFAVNLKLHPKDILGEVTRSSYARIPVYSGSLDNILGIIYAKDLLTAWRTDGLILIPDLMRPAYFVPDDLPVSELLREFKKGRQHFAVVRGSDGRPSGIVTIEDVLEEIVGKVYDESRLS